MNSFQTSTSCIFQVWQITSAEHERWFRHRLTKYRLTKYLAATMTKERESAALALMNIALRKLA